MASFIDQNFSYWFGDVEGLQPHGFEVSLNFSKIELVFVDSLQNRTDFKLELSGILYSQFDKLPTDNDGCYEIFELDFYKVENFVNFAKTQSFAEALSSYVVDDKQLYYLRIEGFCGMHIVASSYELTNFVP